MEKKQKPLQAAKIIAIANQKGGTEADALDVTLATQMERVIRDEPFDSHEGILHHDEGVDLVPTNIELFGMEMTLVNAMSREFTSGTLSSIKRHDTACENYKQGATAKAYADFTREVMRDGEKQRNRHEAALSR